MTPEILRQERGPRGETSAEVRARVVQAYAVQLSRAGRPNHLLADGEVQRYCPLSREDARLLEAVISKFNLSARSLHRILKVARTIADLDRSAGIATPHLREAVSYRCPERPPD